MTVEETVLANKVKLGSEEALELVKGKSEIVAARGKKVTRLDLKDKPSEEDLLAVLLGPTGNLRAPTLVVGKKVLVGFSPETYGEFF